MNVKYQEMGFQPLAPRIWVFPAEKEPISSDVGLIEGENRLYLFDVGCGERSRKALQTVLKGEVREGCAVLSHFHRDHIENLDEIPVRKVFAGAHTQKYLREGRKTECIVVNRTIVWSDGVELTFFPIPSSHAKGSIGLMVDQTFCLFGRCRLSGESCRENGL